MSESTDNKLRRRAEVSQGGIPAGHLEEGTHGEWFFRYLAEYQGPPVSLTMPVQIEPYQFTSFPPVFEGLLPEGPQLESLLRLHKIDRNDTFRQLVTVGADMVGSLTVKEAPNTSWVKAAEQ
ncbi:MAG: HipA N-terminal domain-containing protein [Verrucomicrobiae bacterium]|nr:HipA N-terminal domain-containing protein [Verrucomicrobiae bacterium]